MPEFKAETCEHCGQQTTYLIPIDRGTALIVKALAAAIKKKGINAVHMEKEMEIPRPEWTYARAITDGKLTSIQIGNRTRPRIHGLIAMVDGERGNWCLTRKGAAFLRGEAVPKFAIVKKGTADRRSHKEEYWNPEENMITIHDVNIKGAPMWEAINFDIVEGRILTEPPVKSNQTQLL